MSEEANEGVPERSGLITPDNSPNRQAMAGQPVSEFTLQPQGDNAARSKTVPELPSSPKSLHSEALKKDEQHYAEHYVLEHVLDHVEEMFRDIPADPEQQQKRSQERRHVFAQMQGITESMDDAHVMVDLPLTETDSIEDITSHMLERLVREGVLQQRQRESAEGSMRKSSYMKPAMGHRLAVPVLYSDMRREDGTVPSTICAFARLHHGTHLGEHDGEGIRFVFLLLEHELSPGEVEGGGNFEQANRRKSKSQAHVSAAEAITFILSDVDALDHLLLAKNAKDVHDTIEQYMRSHSAWEKGNEVKPTIRLSQNEIGLTWEPEHLPFGGIKRDAARRIFTTVWLQDWKDGCTFQSLAVVLFMFFACVAPAIAFGSLLDYATGGADGEYCKKKAGCVGDHCECVGDIGVIEMLLSSALCGIVYAVIGGSPLTVLGGTGPILAFTGVLYKFANDIEVDFLPFYAWTGVWIGVLSFLLAAFDGAVIIKKVSRFTDEIFSGLISMIFTISAILDLVKVHSNGRDELCTGGMHANLTRTELLGIVNEVEGGASTPACVTLLQVEAKTLVSVVLALGTYMIAMSMRAARKSIYTSPLLRNFLADFGVAISIFAMVLVHEFIFTSEVDLLKVPNTFEPTNGRDWYVGLSGLPFWAVLVAIIPGMMGMLLVWLDNNITFRLVNSADHKLVKGTAYHWDTLLTGGFIAVCSLFGLPWLVAATVRSLLLVKSLATTEDVNGRVRIMHVNDNRVVGFAIHCLVLGAVFVPELLKKIPLPVIFGLFLYMGVSSMAGNTMFERTQLLAIWEAHNYPSDSYIRKVPRSSIVKFTLIQLFCLAGLYIVKSTAIGISFPIFIGLLPLTRRAISKWGIVEEKFCELLDPEELPEEETVGDVSEQLGAA